MTAPTNPMRTLKIGPPYDVQIDMSRTIAGWSPTHAEQAQIDLHYRYEAAKNAVLEEHRSHHAWWDSQPFKYRKSHRDELVLRDYCYWKESAGEFGGWLSVWEYRILRDLGWETKTRGIVGSDTWKATRRYCDMRAAFYGVANLSSPPRWFSDVPALPDCDPRKHFKASAAPPAHARCSGTWDSAANSHLPVTYLDGKVIGSWHRREVREGSEMPRWVANGLLRYFLPMPCPEYPHGFYFDERTRECLPYLSDPWASPAPQPLPDPPEAKPYGDNPPMPLAALQAIHAAHRLPADALADPSFLSNIPRELVVGFREDGGRRYLVTYPGDRGLFTVAPNRSGKGVSAIGVNAICHRGSWVCFDPKGENATSFARWRSEVLGQPTFVFDPLGVIADRDIPRARESDPAGSALPLRAGFNPLEFIARSRNPITASKMIAAAFIPVQGNNPFWSESAQSFFAAFHCFVALDPAYPNPRTYRNLWADLTQQTEADFRAMLAVMAESTIGFVRSEAIEFLEGAADTVKGYRKTLKTQAGRILDDPAIIDCFSAGTVDFGRLQTEKLSVFICLPGDVAAEYANFMRVLLACMFSAIERCGLPEPGVRRERTLIVFDEFATLGRSQTLLEAMPRLPGYGVTVWPFCQDLNQVRTLYGEGWETLIAAAGVVQAFGGTPDNFTAEYLSRKTGTVTDTTVSDTSQTVGPGGSRSLGSTGRPGMFPYQFANLSSGAENKLRQILFFAGEGYAEAKRLETFMDFPVWKAFDDHRRARRT